MDRKNISSAFRWVVGVSGHSRGAVSCSLFCSCIKSKACNESKDVNMDILLLANWQKVKCSGGHVVCNYWWCIHSLLWFCSRQEDAIA